MFDLVEIKDTKQEIGRYIKTLRKKQNITQAQLAETLDISRTTLQNLETGGNFTVDTLLKVLKELTQLESLHHKIVEAREQIGQIQSLY